MPDLATNVLYYRDNLEVCSYDDDVIIRDESGNATDA
jgi:hypothetical protein